MWLLERLTPHSAVNWIRRAYLVSGHLDLDALRDAWLAVLGRHDVLRTTIADVDGRPVPRPARGSDSFEFVDASAHPDCAAELADPARRPDGPPARLTVARLAPGRHYAVLLLHRTVADDPTVSIVVDELSAGYRGAALPDLPARYADFASWQRRMETGPQWRRLLDWWTSALTPPPPPLVLPADGDRSGPAAAGCVLRFGWGADTAAGLARLCRQEGSTPLAVLLAGLLAVLHRYSGEERLAVGVPTAVRPPEFAGVAGPFGNLLVLCLDLTGAPTFRELVARVDLAVKEAADHSVLPYAHLVRELGQRHLADRDPRRLPLCDVVLAVAEAPEALPGLPGAEVTRIDLEAEPAAADLALTVEQVQPSVAGALGYRGELFLPVTAAGILDQLRTLLSAALAAPGTAVHELPMDGDRQRAAAAADDRLAAATPAGAPVHELVRRRGDLIPGADAFAWRDGAVSYGQLQRRADAIAARLDAIGVAGAAVAVRMQPGAGQVAASLGLLRAGAHLVWFGTGDAGERGRAVLADLRPACLLTDGDPAGDELARWYRDELGGRLVDIGRDVPEPAGELLAQLPPAVAARVSVDRLAYVAYTSGSTGKPKGIAQSHAAFGQFVTWMAEALDLGPGSRVAQWVAPEHDPSLCEVFATLVGGGTLCPVPERIRVHPEKFLDWLADERVTFLQTVPSFARELLKVLAGGGAERLSLRRLVLMGEALPGELVTGLRAALPDVLLTNMYGPTETIAATWCEITGGAAETGTGTVPIGRSIPGRHVLVLDDADRPCPTGVTGEIVIRSPYVARGYVGDETGGRAFRPVAGFGDGGSGVRCYRTGDLARRRWDGLLEFRGRRDLQVKLQGNRIEIAEVEAALAELDSVDECAVVPLTDADGLVIQLVAYVVPAARTPEQPARADGVTGWRAHLRRRFGRSMVLVSFETLNASLPRNIAGKVDRRRLPAPRALLARTARPPTTWVERRMAEIWAELLGGAPASADETFFAAGGHSLLLPRLVYRVRERFGVEIPIWECFAHSTVAGMSALVVSAGVRDDTAA